MIHYQKQLMEVCQQIGSSLPFALKIKAFGGELTRAMLVQESHRAPLVLVSLKEARSAKNDEVDALWTLFVVCSQLGKLSAAQGCLMVASLLAEELPDQDLSHMEQTPIACQIEAMPTDFSKPALSALALNVEVRYPSFLFQALDLRELEAITLQSSDDNEEPFMEMTYETSQTESP